VAAALGSSGGGALIGGGAAAIETKEGGAAAGAQLEVWLRAVAARPRVVRGGRGLRHGAAQGQMLMPNVGVEVAVASWPEHLQWLAKALVAAGKDGVTVDSLEEEEPSLAMLGLLEAEGLGLIVEEEIGRYRATRPIASGEGGR